MLQWLSRHKILLIVIVFILSRALLILFAADKFFYFEELHTGTVIRDFIEGLRLPLFSYQDKIASGETLFLGVLGVPMFLLFGKTIFALKMTAVMLHSLILCYMMLVLDRFVSQQAALFAGLLSILAPPVWIWTSVKPIYQHSECFLFFIAGLYYLLNYLCSPHPKSRHLLLFGFLNGIGLWYTYSYLIAIVSFFLWGVLIVRRRPRLRAALLCSSSALVGFSPRILQFFQDKVLVVMIGAQPLNDNFLHNTAAKSAMRLIAVFTHHLHQMLFFKLPASAFLYQAIAMVAIGTVGWQCRNVFNPRTQPATTNGTDLCRSILVLYFLIYCTIYSLSNFQISPDPDGYRYLVPLCPVMILLISSFLKDLHNAKQGLLKYSARGLIILLAAMGLNGYLSFLLPITRSALKANLTRPGYSDKAFDWLYAIRLANAVVSDPSYLFTVMAQEKHTHLFYSQLIPICLLYRMPPIVAKNMVDAVGKRQHLLYGSLGRRKQSSLIFMIPPRFHPYFYENYGYILGETSWATLTFWNKTPQAYADLMDPVLTNLSRVPFQYRSFFFEGLGYGIAFRLTASTDLYNRFILQIPPRRRQAFCVGLGRMLGWLDGKAFSARLEAFAPIQSTYRSYCFQGLGIESAYDVWDDQISAMTAAQFGIFLQQDEQKRYYRGLGIGTRRIATDDKRLFKRLKKVIAPDFMRYFMDGYKKITPAP